MTEGFSTLAIAHDRFGDILRRPQHFGRSNPHHLDPFTPQPSITLRITRGPIAHVVRNSVDLDAHFGFGAEEIEHEIAAPFLPPEVNAVGRFAE